MKSRRLKHFTKVGRKELGLRVNERWWLKTITNRITIHRDEIISTMIVN